MATSNVLNCSWFPFSDEPLITGTWYAPKVCDPQLLLPSKSCDGKWHLFTHNWLGIHHYVSDSGIVWEDKQLVEPRGLYPYIYYEDEVFYLLYEKHDSLLNIKRLRGNKEDNISRIEMVSSADLITWSKPRVLLDSRSVPYSGDYLNRNAISRPQLIKVNDVYRLYFGASEMVLQDSKQKVSRYLGCAFSRKLDEKFFLEKPEKPILESDPNDPYSNLACGSVKIIESAGEIFGFQCSAYWDEKKKKSATALRILESVDGMVFTPSGKKPILLPADKGWTSAYIMSCDVRFKDDENCWYCYYSANDRKHGIKQKESVGLMIGSVPTKGRLDLNQQLHEVLFV